MMAQSPAVIASELQSLMFNEGRMYGTVVHVMLSACVLDSDTITTSSVTVMAFCM